MSQAPQPLTLDLERVEHVLIVHLRGSASMADSDKLRKELDGLAGESLPLVVLEMSEMDFICSLGLGAMISMHLKSRHHGGAIRLVNPQPAVRQLLETTRLTKLFPIFDTTDAAVHAQS